MVSAMTTTFLRDCDVAYLDAFPLPGLRSIHGPVPQAVAWNERDGWHNPDPEFDDRCWWVDTGTGMEVPVPPAVIDAVLTPRGVVWEVDFDPDETVEQRTAKVRDELARALGALNAAASRFAGEAHA